MQPQKGNKLNYYMGKASDCISPAHESSTVPNPTGKHAGHLRGEQVTDTPPKFKGKF